MFGANGNCFSACLASVFELPIEEVPNFFTLAGHDEATWWAAVRDWLRPRGFGIISLRPNTGTLVLFEGWLIVSGKSGRGLHHATVWRSGAMVHDPHPDGSGIESPEDLDLLYPLDPSQLFILAK